MLHYTLSKLALLLNQTGAHVDDILLVARNKNLLEEIYMQVKKEIRNMGLIVNGVKILECI